MDGIYISVLVVFSIAKRITWISMDAFTATYSTICMADGTCSVGPRFHKFPYACQLASVASRCT